MPHIIRWDQKPLRLPRLSKFVKNVIPFTFQQKRFMKLADKAPLGLKCAFISNAGARLDSIFRYARAGRRQRAEKGRSSCGWYRQARAALDPAGVVSSSCRLRST